MEAQLKAMRVPELRDVAAKGGIAVPTKVNKDKIISLLLAAPNINSLLNGADDDAAPLAVDLAAPLATDDDLREPPSGFDSGDQSTSPATAPIASAGPAHVPVPVKEADPNPAASNALGSTAVSAVAKNTTGPVKSTPSKQNPTAIPSTSGKTENSSKTAAIGNGSKLPAAEAGVSEAEVPKPLKGSSKPTTDVDMTKLQEEERRKRRAGRFKDELQATAKPNELETQTAVTTAKATPIEGSSNGAAADNKTTVDESLASKRAKKFAKPTGAPVATVLATTPSLPEGITPAMIPDNLTPDDLKVIPAGLLAEEWTKRAKRMSKFKKTDEPTKTSLKRAADEDASEPAAKRQKSDPVEALVS